jgi:hypothetical protein
MFKRPAWQSQIFIKKTNEVRNLHATNYGSPPFDAEEPSAGSISKHGVCRPIQTLTTLGARWQKNDYMFAGCNHIFNICPIDFKFQLIINFKNVYTYLSLKPRKRKWLTCAWLNLKKMPSKCRRSSCSWCAFPVRVGSSYPTYRWWTINSCPRIRLWMNDVDLRSFQLDLLV